MFGFGILSGLTFLPLVGAAFILTQRGDSDSSLRNVRWAALLTTIATWRQGQGSIYSLTSATMGRQRMGSEWTPVLSKLPSTLARRPAAEQF